MTINASHETAIQASEQNEQASRSACEARSNCMQQVLNSWTGNSSGESGFGKKGLTDNLVRVAVTTQIDQRTDFQWLQFNADVPLSHFSPIDTKKGVYRSGRPNGDAGVAEEVKAIWGDNSPEHAGKTTIIELRGIDPQPYYQDNEDQKKSERDAAAALSITHKDFPMEAQEFQKPQYIQSVLDYIDGQTKQGQRVVMHCYHGTDRTGLIAAAYQLTHLSPNDIRYRPNHALEMAIESMKEQGFRPEHYPKLVQSLDQFIGWKQHQMIEGEHKGKR